MRIKMIESAISLHEGLVNSQADALEEQGYEIIDIVSFHKEPTNFPDGSEKESMLSNIRYRKKTESFDSMALIKKVLEAMPSKG